MDEFQEVEDLQALYGIQPKKKGRSKKDRNRFHAEEIVSRKKFPTWGEVQQQAPEPNKTKKQVDNF